MSFRILAQAGQPVYNLKEFIVDAYEDIAEINTQGLAVGSTAFDIETSKHYMLNTRRQWVEVEICGGSGKNNPDEYDIIYDGGLITSDSTNEGESEEGSDDVIYDGGEVTE